MGAVAASVCPGCKLVFPRGLVSRCPRDDRKLERESKREFHPLIGQTIAGRYRVLYELGRGSVATVFGAEHTGIGRAVALKVLDPETTRAPDLVARFEREARAASRIESPHVVRLLDFGRAEEGLFYMVMELLDGPTLGAVAASRGALPWREAARTALEIALGLAAAHAVGVVHRDLEPDNVVLAGTKRVAKVLDFGIAKIRESGFEREASDESRRRPLTLQGVLVGTAGFVSPEAIAHEPVGPPADLYALGAILFQLLAGRPPFLEPARAALLALHLGTVPPRVSEVVVDPARVAWPEPLEALVAELLAKRPEERPRDALSVARTLAHLLGISLREAGGPPTIPPEGPPSEQAHETVRMDLDDLREELRPTRRVEPGPDARTASHETPVHDRTTERPQARWDDTSGARRGRRALPIVLLCAGVAAALLLSFALVRSFPRAAPQLDVAPHTRARTSPHEPAAPDRAPTAEPRAPNDPPAASQPRAEAPHAGPDRVVPSVQHDAGAAAPRARPGGSGPAAATKRTRGSARPALDIERAYP